MPNVSHLVPLPVLAFCVTSHNQNGFIKLRVLGYNFLVCFSV